MKLHFPWAALAPLFEELDTATTIRELYGRTTEKGLWIIGDQGIYVMANTTNGVHHKSSEKPLVVYATECDPTKLDFDTWWSVKQASFGGDDGIDYLHIDELRAMAQKPPRPRMVPSNLVIDFSSAAMILSLQWRPARKTS